MFEEILKELKSRKIIQTDLSWEENIPNGLWTDISKIYEYIIDDLDVDKHRHYETSTTVIKLQDRFLGINLISNIYSESASPDDIGREIEFFEVEEVKTTTYVKCNS